MAVALTNVDKKIRKLVAVLNGLGLGETVASCDGHDRGLATIFAGYRRAPLLPGGVFTIYRRGLAIWGRGYRR